jgi:hypothetical protein
MRSGGALLEQLGELAGAADQRRHLAGGEAPNGAEVDAAALGEARAGGQHAGRESDLQRTLGEAVDDPRGRGGEQCPAAVPGAGVAVLVSSHGAPGMSL